MKISLQSLLSRGVLMVLALALAMCNVAWAADKGEVALQTAKGPVTLHIIQHASMVLDWNGLTIYVDPVGAVAKYRGLGAPDLILITHAHPDHMSPDTLKGLDTSRATLVEPPSVADKLGTAYGKVQHVMANGDSFSDGDLTIEAVPMYNLPASPDAYHPKGWGNGYLLTLGGKRLYISGDTAGTPEMRALKNIDVAFVCMNLPWTMDVKDAADAVLAFKPAVVYPYHYRGQDTAQFKRLVNARDPAIEVRLRDWYAK